MALSRRKFLLGAALAPLAAIPFAVVQTRKEPSAIIFSERVPSAEQFIATDWQDWDDWPGATIVSLAPYGNRVQPWMLA